MSFINQILKVFVGDKAQKDVQALQPLLQKIKQHEQALSQLSADELREKTIAFKAYIAAQTSALDQQIDTLKQESLSQQDIDANEALYTQIDELQEQRKKIIDAALDHLLPEAFAVVRETAKRFAQSDSITVTATEQDRIFSADKDYVVLTGDQAKWHTSWNAAGKPVRWDMVHYDVQLIGGMVLHQGKVAEMQTGEGKTLVATLPVYLNALSGLGVHLVTVNDYLAKRDSAWMAPIFEFHGLTVDCIDNHQPNSLGRRKAYLADITYGTNNEFGFDYLRDNMAHQPGELVQRPHHYAIVDEVDSVLIDDARTPLIISGPVPEGDRHEFNELKPQVERLVNAQRNYLTGVLVEAKKKIAEGDLKEGGFQLLRVYRGLPKNKALIKFLSEEGIKQLLQKTERQYMQDNNREMHQVDETLLFVIDEKNNQIELTNNGIQELSTADNSDFFILPDIGTEMAKIEQKGLEPSVQAAEKEQ